MPARHMPLIGIPTCLRKVNERIIHGVNDKYPTAVIDSTGCLPILIPAVGSKVDICGLLDRLDGVLLTGSPSNVHPSQYGGEPSHPETLHDPERDATTLPLIREAVRRDLPILAICRGIQELNVAPDGQIEAVSLPGARFVVGVQWHPEHKVLENPFSSALFSAFARACAASLAGAPHTVRAA